MLRHLLEWLLWVALVVLLIGLAAIAAIPSITARTPAEPPPPTEHRLLHYWWTEHGGHWVRDIPLYDRYGSYFFRDFRANVAVVAILQVRGVLPHTMFEPVEASGPTYTNLFVGTPFETKVVAEANTLLVILPDLSIESFQLHPNDALEIYRQLSASMKTGKGPTSFVGEVKQWASERGREDVTKLLSQYENAEEAPSFNPGP